MNVRTSLMFVNYHPIFKRKLHDACTINPCIHVNFCECDTRAILPASVGFDQAHPNNALQTSIAMELKLLNRFCGISTLDLSQLLYVM